MVDKKMVISKKNLLNIFGILIVVGFLALIIAAPGLGFIGRPSNVQNFTAANTTMNISCGNNPGAGLDGENIVNVSFLFNESGGPTSLNGLYGIANLIPNTSTGYTIVYNTSGNQTVFFNGTVLITGLNDSSRYNITCLFTNLSGWNWTSSANNVSIDNTPPRVTDINVVNISLAGVNWTENIMINVTANDSIWKSYSKNLNVTSGYANITAVAFNLTNGTSNYSAGIVSINRSASVWSMSIKNSKFETLWNTTYNISTLSEGFHYIYIYSNDTNESNKVVANVNNTEYIRILVDRWTPPRVTNLTFNKAARGDLNNSLLNDSITINVSVWDANVSSVYWNITNSTNNFIIGNLTRASCPTGQSFEAYWNATLNTTWFPDGKYNLTVIANDSAVMTYSSQENRTESVEIHIDNTAPSVTHTCSPSSVKVGQIVTCTCTGDDGLGTGINSTSDGTSSSTTSSITTSITTSADGSFSRTCTAYDKVFHKTAVSTSYTVTNADSASGTGSSGGSSSRTKATITADTPVIMKGFVEESGIKQIEVTTTTSVQNAEIAVTGYETQPVTVSTAKSNAYRYMYVNAPTLVTSLKKATMTIQVEKTWVSGQGITKDDVALFKYDETASKWNELSTTYSSEDTTYYYYIVDLTSFSYFAIAPKAVLTGGETSSEEQPSGEQPTSATTGLLNLPYWVWIIIGLVVLAIIVGVIVLKKKR